MLAIWATWSGLEGARAPLRSNTVSSKPTRTSRPAARPASTTVQLVAASPCHSRGRPSGATRSSIAWARRHRARVLVLEDHLDQHAVNPFGPWRRQQRVGVWHREHPGLDPDPAIEQDLTELGRAGLREIERHDIRRMAPGAHRRDPSARPAQVDVFLGRAGNLQSRNRVPYGGHRSIVGFCIKRLSAIARAPRMEMHRSGPSRPARPSVAHQLLERHRHIRMIRLRVVAIERALDHVPDLSGGRRAGRSANRPPVPPSDPARRAGSAASGAGFRA